MAELNLKVSEEKVRATIQVLTDKNDKLIDLLSQLRANREKLEKAYTGPTATIGINAIKKRESEVEAAIRKYKLQRDKLQTYLDIMNEADAKARAAFEESLSKTNDLFK